MVLMIGGKIAPRPSLRSRRSRIHCSARRSARARKGRRRRASPTCSIASTKRKKPPQQRPRKPLTAGWLGVVPGTRSSSIRARSGTGQEGLSAQMMLSGTTIVRDQDDIS